MSVAEETSPAKKHHDLRRAGPVALVATIIPISGSIVMVTAGPFLAVWLRGSGWPGWAAFTVAYVILGAVTFAPTYTTSIIAGWAFGFVMGFSAVMIGTVCGAVLCYLVAQKFAADRVQEVFGHHPKWEIVRRAMLEEKPLKTLWIVFLMRLSPVLPFGTTNVLMSTTGVPLNLYTFGTILGLLPRLGLISLAAAGADHLDLKHSSSWWMLAAGLAATGVCILVMAYIGKRALDRAIRGDSPGVTQTHADVQ